MSIGSEAFYDCASVSTLSIDSQAGASLTSIGLSAFNRCSSVARVNIPKTVTTIGNGAFLHCSSLKTVSFKGNAPTVDGDSSDFPTDNEGFVFKIRIGASGFESWSPIEQEVLIGTTTLDSSGNLVFVTDAIETGSIKVLFAPDLSSPFTDVTGLTFQGENGVTISAENAALQGGKGFFKVEVTPSSGRGGMAPGSLDGSTLSFNVLTSDDSDIVFLGLGEFSFAGGNEIDFGPYTYSANGALGTARIDLGGPVFDFALTFNNATGGTLVVSRVGTEPLVTGSGIFTLTPTP